jgi:hypothetical protein
MFAVPELSSRIWQPQSNPQGNKKLRWKDGSFLIQRFTPMARRVSLLPAFHSPARGAYVVECNRASAKEGEAEGESCQGQGELKAMLSHQSIVKMNFGDGDGKINANGECGGACEETENHEQTAEEFSKG